MSSSCLALPDAGQSTSADTTREGCADASMGVSAVRGGRGSLAEYLNQVVDHRSRQGLRHELGFLLAVVIAATASTGHDEVVAQAEWAAAAPPWVLLALGLPHPLTGTVTAPSESTLRRALAKVKAPDLQRLTAQWVQTTASAPRADTDTDAGKGATDGSRLAGGGHRRKECAWRGHRRLPPPAPAQRDYP